MYKTITISTPSSTVRVVRLDFQGESTLLFHCPLSPLRENKWFDLDLGPHVMKCIRDFVVTRQPTSIVVTNWRTEKVVVIKGSTEVTYNILHVSTDGLLTCDRYVAPRF